MVTSVDSGQGELWSRGIFVCPLRWSAKVVTYQSVWIGYLGVHSDCGSPWLWWSAMCLRAGRCNTCCGCAVRRATCGRLGLVPCVQFVHRLLVFCVYNLFIVCSSSCCLTMFNDSHCVTFGKKNVCVIPAKSFSDCMRYMDSESIHVKQL